MEFDSLRGVEIIPCIEHLNAGNSSLNKGDGDMDNLYEPPTKLSILHIMTTQCGSNDNFSKLQ